jgi:hypothetical protein
MSTEYFYTCDRWSRRAPGQAIFNIAKGAKNWSPDSWIAVRVMENDGYFCPECRNQLGRWL